MQEPKGFLTSVCAMICLAWANVFSFPSGLIAYYPFDGDAIDYSDHGNNGTISGPAWVSGYYGNALHFNGAGDYVGIQDNGSLAITNGITICAWIKPETGNMWYRVVGKSNASNSDDCWGIGEAMAGGICFTLWKNGSQTYTNGHTPLVLNQWNHIAGTWDGNVMHIYQNDVLQPESGNVTPPIDNSANPLYVGKLPNNTYYFTGTVDEVMIFNRGLSASEIDSIFRGAYLGKSPVLQPVPSPTANTKPFLAWSNVANAQGYTVQLDTMPSCANPIRIYSTVDTSLAVSQPLPPGTIYWRVITMSHGYSTIGSFVVLDSATPVLVPYVPKVTLNLRPRLAWHPVAQAAQYTINVANNAAFTNPFIQVPLSDTVYTPGANFSSGRIFWHVKSDLSTRWSQTDSFVIQSDTVPFLSRFNGDTVKNVRPRFSWNKVSLATAYRIELSTNSAFVGPLTTLVSDTFFVPLADLSKGLWFWRASCDRNYLVFPVPDSLRIDNTVSVLSIGNENSSLIRQAKINLLTARWDVSIYTLNGKEIAVVHSGVGNHVVPDKTVISEMKLRPGVYLAVFRSNGSVLASSKFVQN